MIDVSEVLNDPDVCSAWKIERTAGGTFAAGGWQAGTKEIINAFGAVRNVSGKELDQLPDADRISEVLSFRSVTKMYVTNTQNQATSDILLWHHQRYRVIAMFNYSEQGYFKALATRMEGN